QGAARARRERARGGRLHGGALRRFRAVPPAAEGDDAAAVDRPVPAARPRGLFSAEAHPPAGRGGGAALRGRARACRRAARSGPQMIAFWTAAAALAIVALALLLR